MEKEYTEVYVLKGGWREWTEKNFPVEKKVKKVNRSAEDGKSTTEEEKS